MKFRSILKVLAVLLLLVANFSMLFLLMALRRGRHSYHYELPKERNFSHVLTMIKPHLSMPTTTIVKDEQFLKNIKADMSKYIQLYVDLNSAHNQYHKSLNSRLSPEKAGEEMSRRTELYEKILRPLNSIRRANKIASTEKRLLSERDKVAAGSEASISMGRNESSQDVRGDSIPGPLRRSQLLDIVREPQEEEVSDGKAADMTSEENKESGEDDTSDSQSSQPSGESVDEIEQPPDESDLEGMTQPTEMVSQQEDKHKNKFEEPNNVVHFDDSVVSPKTITNASSNSQPEPEAQDPTKKPSRTTHQNNELVIRGKRREHSNRQKRSTGNDYKEPLESLELRLMEDNSHVKKAPEYIVSNDPHDGLRNLLHQKRILEALTQSQLPGPVYTNQQVQDNETTRKKMSAQQAPGSLYNIDNNLVMMSSVNKKNKKHNKKHSSNQAGKVKKKKKTAVGMKKGGHKKNNHNKSEKKFIKEKKFKAAKKGKKVAKGNGGQGGKKGMKLYKDKGFKKKGFKNVYHKEEYGQKKSYFDEYRDKDFKKKWKKFDDKYNYAQMKKWQGKDVKGAKKIKDQGEKFKKYDKGKWKKKYQKDSKEHSSEESMKNKKDDYY